MASASALATIERILEGKTTLKTQRLSHSNIICIGTELLEHLQKVMREDQEKAVTEAVDLSEKKAAAKLRREIDSVTEILQKDKDMALQSLADDYRYQMLEQEMRLKAEEEERALDAKAKYEIEKENAVKRAIENERKDRDEFIENQIKLIVQKLEHQARLNLDKELLQQKRILQGEFQKEKEEAILQTKKDCEKQKEISLREAIEKYGNEIDRLARSRDYTMKMLEIEKKRKYEIQQKFLELKEDYKRFQNYTGKFHSDYLLQ